MLRRRQRSAALTPFDRPRRLFGELMLDARYLSEDELEDVLDAQRSEPGRRLGYLCMERGYARPAEVMDVLLRQLPVAVPFAAR